MHHFRNTYPTNTNTVSGYLIPDDEDNNTLPLAEINIAALQLTAPTNLSTVSIPYSYRYGFNGQEHANELNSSTYDFGARMYDARVGRFFSTDPWSDYFPFWSPYIFGANNPIIFLDYQGLFPKRDGSHDGEIVYDEGQRYIWMVKGDKKQSKSMWVKVPTAAGLTELHNNIQTGINKAREKGYNVAADNLQRWLNGTGGIKNESLDFLKQSSIFNDKRAVIRSWFETKENSKGLNLKIVAQKLKDNESTTFSDYWQASVSGESLSFNEDERDLFFAWGTSTLNGKGNFTLTRKGNEITVSGTIEYIWRDTYNWEPGCSVYIPGVGNVEDTDLKLMEYFKGARQFKGECKWTEKVEYKYTIDDKGNLQRGM